MHVAIDDTYGPENVAPSKYVTGSRRTYVAVEFPDSSVEEVRDAVRDCLSVLPAHLGFAPKEFHFSEIYNRRGLWLGCPKGANLAIFELFGAMYRSFQWKIHVQTVDNRTFSDHGVDLSGSIGGINLNERDGKALALLLFKLKQVIPGPPEPLVVRMDAGRAKPGADFAQDFFREWGDLYNGRYAESHEEPLVQIADFLAFIENRSTHLQIKPYRTEMDLLFLNFVGGMDIQSADLIRKVSDRAQVNTDVDLVHAEDRRAKGLE